MSSKSISLWTAASIATVLTLLVIDVSDGNDVNLTGAFVIPALVAGAILSILTAVLRRRAQRTARLMRLMNAVGSSLDSAPDYGGKLQAFADATVLEFADWSFFDRVLPDGSRQRVASAENAVARSHSECVSRTEIRSTLVAYAELAHRDGPQLFKDPPQDLCEALFSSSSAEFTGISEIVIIPVSIDSTAAGEFYFVAHRPTPGFGDMEIPQVASLVRSAALAAEAARLIDRLTFTEANLRKSRDEIAAIVGNIADGVIAQDRLGSVVYANPVAAAMLGLDIANGVDSALGASDILDQFLMFDASGNLLPPERFPGRRALDGEDDPVEMIKYVTQSTGEERWSKVKSTAVCDQDGIPDLVISVMEDMTEHVRRESAQRFLATAGAGLVESLDDQRMLEAVARAAVPDMADWCAIQMQGDDGLLRIVALSQTDREDQTLGEEVLRMFESHVDEPIGARRTVLTGEARIFKDSTDELLSGLAVTDEERELVEMIAFRSGVVAPIVIAGRASGAFSLISSSSGRIFNEDDLETAVELGRRAGAAIENARLQKDRARILGTLQKSLIPPRLPVVPGFDIAANYRPAELDPAVGGDFYDVFPLPDDSWALVIGDVCGKGPEAASVTALARYTIRTAAMQEPDPEAILATLNGALLDQVEDDQFCTVALAKVHTNDEISKVEIVSAGHPLPVKLGHDGPRALGSPGTLLGVVPTPELPRTSDVLSPGESLLLYTDGLAAGEHTDDTQFAIDLVKDFHASSARDAVEWIDSSAFEARRGPQRDDVAIVVASKTHSDLIGGRSSGPATTSM